MKKFFQVLSVFIVFTSFLFPQRVFDQVVISDGVGNSQILTFGLDSTATDGIDISLDEGLLPPFPPAGAFEARLFLPENSFSGTSASKKDFRFATFTVPYTGQKEFRLAYQPGAGSTQITVSWNFPGNVTGVLQDIFGGVLINIPMTLTGSYGVTPFGIDRLKMLINYDGVIPVELLSFNASVTGASVNLNWQTATELNNSGFEIQRKSETSQWKKVGFVEGAGTTTESRSYSFSDSYSGQGTVFYRLKQIDFDGTSSYSKVIEVDLSNPTDFKLNQNYPNPFNPSTTVSFTIPKASNVKLNIYNQIGQQVVELVNRNLEAGSYNFIWNASNQSSGIYFYELQANEFKSVRKMTLIK
jgi:hypothetical protein